LIFLPFVRPERIRFRIRIMVKTNGKISHVYTSVLTLFVWQKQSESIASLLERNKKCRDDQIRGDWWAIDSKPNSDMIIAFSDGLWIQSLDFESEDWFSEKPGTVNDCLAFIWKVIISAILTKSTIEYF